MTNMQDWLDLKYALYQSCFIVFHSNKTLDAMFSLYEKILY